ncbi:TPA: hypothetical protein ACGUVV_004826 [Vibrio vulnificus]|uniref:hypothetical protein n=1 Tax=Vibrio vulnificus TaxID=672 RepID=UPI0005F20FF7|nr:hypothetical protein [Vibrio vulnificus]HAS6022118.1 hypothetical protein [Vibrio vulnificus]HAT8553869.1 hypothetical protein [Vibrio vulnificus]
MSKVLPSEAELRESYTAFHESAFGLLDQVDKKPLNLMFAAVNAQIALELFLKYLFTRLGRGDEILKSNKHGSMVDYKEFNQILNLLYSDKGTKFGKKKELVQLMQIRNSIVHRGQKAAWDPEVAKITVKALFFMHATMKFYFNEVLFFDNYTPHKISQTKVWRVGAESFCEEIADIYHCDVLNCTNCKSDAVISGEILGFYEGCCVSDLVCLCCLTSINIENEARLLYCPDCDDRSYLIDALNEQDEQLYVGKCMACPTNTWVRKCGFCEEFYHPSSENEVEYNGFYFCSTDCKECYV